MGLKAEGLDAAKKKMRRIQRGDFLTRPTRKFVTNVKADVKVYPDALDPSWRRTGNLKRKWWAGVSEEEIIFTNPAQSRGNYYAAYVQDEDQQVWWHHVTGWVTIQAAVKKRLETLKRDLIRELKK
jgi:hypothetical protein